MNWGDQLESTKKNFLKNFEKNEQHISYHDSLASFLSWCLSKTRSSIYATDYVCTASYSLRKFLHEQIYGYKHMFVFVGRKQIWVFLRINSGWCCCLQE